MVAALCFCPSLYVGKGLFGTGGKCEWIVNLLICECDKGNKTNTILKNSGDNNFNSNQNAVASLHISHITFDGESTETVGK